MKPENLLHYIAAVKLLAILMEAKTSGSNPVPEKKIAEEIFRFCNPGKKLDSRKLKSYIGYTHKIATDLQQSTDAIETSYKKVWYPSGRKRVRYISLGKAGTKVMFDSILIKYEEYIQELAQKYEVCLKLRNKFCHLLDSLYVVDAPMTPKRRH